MRTQVVGTGRGGQQQEVGPGAALDQRWRGRRRHRDADEVVARAGVDRVEPAVAVDLVAAVVAVDRVVADAALDVVVARPARERRADGAVVDEEVVVVAAVEHDRSGDIRTGLEVVVTGLAVEAGTPRALVDQRVVAGAAVRDDRREHAGAHDQRVVVASEVPMDAGNVVVDLLPAHSGDLDRLVAGGAADVVDDVVLGGAVDVAHAGTAAHVQVEVAAAPRRLADC